MANIEQLDKWLTDVDRDMRDLQRIIGTGLHSEGDRALVNRVERIEDRISALEYGAQLRTTLIYTSIAIGIINLIVAAGLYI